MHFCRLDREVPPLTRDHILTSGFIGDESRDLQRFVSTSSGFVRGHRLRGNGDNYVTKSIRIAGRAERVGARFSSVCCPCSRANQPSTSANDAISGYHHCAAARHANTCACPNVASAANCHRANATGCRNTSSGAFDNTGSAFDNDTSAARGRADSGAGRWQGTA